MSKAGQVSPFVVGDPDRLSDLLVPFLLLQTWTPFHTEANPLGRHIIGDRPCKLELSNDFVEFFDWHGGRCAEGDIGQVP